MANNPVGVPLIETPAERAVREHRRKGPRQKQTQPMINAAQAAKDAVVETQAQSKALRDTVNEMGRQTEYQRDSAEAAITAAKVATESLQDARDRTKTELRAYVLLKSIEIKGLAPDGPLSIEVQVANFGRTPALDVFIRGMLEIDKGPCETSGGYRQKEDFLYSEDHVKAGDLGPDPNHLATFLQRIYGGDYSRGIRRHKQRRFVHHEYRHMVLQGHF